ncbi:type II toxin-antitoxin system YoeB family toxin [Pseudomonas sp. TWI628]|uniref:type II toxin-antitoxin system YoeB family toxin n=1 Tax=Pseudomonas sp. TWI628 TaxID=3136788 RepID=UPI003207F8BE
MKSKQRNKTEAHNAVSVAITSRRITREHRLVYLFEGGQMTILQCRYHYDD